MAAPLDTRTEPGTLTTERRNGPEHIWRGVGMILHSRFEAAHQALRANGDDEPTIADVVDAAYSMQADLLANADGRVITTSQLTANNLAKVILGIPRTARALNALEESRGTPTGTVEGELSAIMNTVIDANHDVAAALSCMPPEMMDDLMARLARYDKQLIKEKWGLPSIGTGHLHRIIAGQSREVAVWRALITNLPKTDDEDEPQWSVRQGTAEEDRYGGDLIVADPEGTTLWVDVKANGGFGRSVSKLHVAGYISETTLTNAHRNGYILLVKNNNPRHPGSRQCIFDADRLGQIDRFQYDPTDQKRATEFIMDCFDDEEWSEAAIINTRPSSRARELGARALS